MEKEEIKEYLKKNLKINLSSSSEDEVKCGYYSRANYRTITVKSELILDGEVISKDSTSQVFRTQL